MPLCRQSMKPLISKEPKTSPLTVRRHAWKTRFFTSSGPESVAWDTTEDLKRTTCVEVSQWRSSNH